MRHVHSTNRVTVSFETRGRGPHLVLVHGSFSDHRSNWAFVAPQLERQFTLTTVARRGRGETTATDGHGLEDDARDVVAVLQSLSEPAYLLGHSYGAHAALLAAAAVPGQVQRLVLYEPAVPSVIPREALVRLDALAARKDWDAFAASFFVDQLRVPAEEIEALRDTEHWPPILADAPATVGDLRALSRYDFQPERFRDLDVPVVLQVGTESLRELYATDALAKVLPEVRIQELEGQAHEGMTTAPDLYVDAVSQVLLS
jgi:pimeloyl-ACP methyl ester carboxylesterase